jgi:four helix bundle protein
MEDKKELKTKVKSFTGLRAWQEGHKLVLIIYGTTENFPRKEVFGLISQMRRSAVSITSNIAEGFSRKSVKEKVQFYSMALGSLTELQNQLLIARDVKYIETKEFLKIAEQAIVVSKIINGLIKKLTLDT